MKTLKLKATEVTRGITSFGPWLPPKHLSGSQPLLMTPRPWWPHCTNLPGRSTWIPFCDCRWCLRNDLPSLRVPFGHTSVAWPCHSLRRDRGRESSTSLVCINGSSKSEVTGLPSEAYDWPPSMTLPHQPEAHGTAVTPRAPSSWVTFEYLKGSLQVPSSPRDLHWKHRRNRPTSEFVWWWRGERDSYESVTVQECSWPSNLIFLMIEIFRVFGECW